MLVIVHLLSERPEETPPGHDGWTMYGNHKDFLLDADYIQRYRERKKGSSLTASVSLMDAPRGDADYPSYEDIVARAAEALKLLPFTDISIRSTAWTLEQLSGFFSLLDLSKKPTWNIDYRNLHLIPLIHRLHKNTMSPLIFTEWDQAPQEEFDENLQEVPGPGPEVLPIFESSLADSKKMVGYRDHLPDIWSHHGSVWVMWSHLSYWNVKLYNIMLGFMNPLRVQRRLPTALMRRLFETLCIREEVTVCGTKWLMWQSDWDEGFDQQS